MWRVSILVFIIVELYVIIEVAKDQITEVTLCDNSTYLFLQISNSFILIAFGILGFFINKRVDEQKEAENQYEIAFRK